jgi:hypothetical protein
MPRIDARLHVRRGPAAQMLTNGEKMIGSRKCEKVLALEHDLRISARGAEQGIHVAC